MRGFLYKEFMSNRLNFLHLGIVTLLCFSIQLMAMADEIDNTAKVLIAAMGYLFLFFLLNCLTMMMVQTDEQKLPAYFAVATPKCVQGVVWTKYVFHLMVAGMILTACTIYNALTMIMYGDAVSMTALFIMLFYFHIFSLSFELPFQYRFGMKIGSLYKSIIFIAVVFGGIVYALFGDLSILNMDRVYELILQMSEGRIPDWMMLLGGCFPFAAMGLYYASCKLSCRLYLKGVENYAK